MNNLPPEESPPPQHRRRGDRPFRQKFASVVRKVNDWLARSPLVAYLILVLSISYGFYKQDQNTTRIDGQQQDLIEARKDSRDKFQTAISSIVAVQVKNCEGDHKFRIQYKKRGEAEKLLLELFLSLAQDNIDSGRGGANGIQTSEGFIKQFGPLTQQIHIIPVPKCDEQARTLIREIERIGGVVPASVLESALHKESGHEADSPGG